MVSIKELILSEIARRGGELYERIIDRSLDKYVRTELTNRLECLQSLYWWIKDNIHDGNEKWDR